MQKTLLIIWFLIVLGGALFLFFLTPAAGGPHYTPIEIRAESGFQEIAGVLSESGIIRCKYAFMLYGVFSGSAHQLKPGNYILSAGSSTPAIVRVLSRGPAIDREITIPEGATLKDIGAMLAGAGILPSGALQSYEAELRKIGDYEFLENAKNLEGFLFPDTYKFFLNSETSVVAKKFLDNFEKKAQPLLLTNDQRHTTNDILITASLLEKEAPDFNDRRLIAGILYKRLKMGMPLQVDATITYAKCGGAFLTCEDPKVYRKDLKFQSPYNTYLYNGLPPGPIGNPGLEAIRAALNPISSEYLYYLSDPKTKKTIFSRTLDEHNENRARYLGP